MTKVENLAQNALPENEQRDRTNMSADQTQEQKMPNSKLSYPGKGSLFIEKNQIENWDVFKTSSSLFPQNNTYRFVRSPLNGVDFGAINFDETNIFNMLPPEYFKELLPEPMSNQVSKSKSSQPALNELPHNSISQEKESVKLDLKPTGNQICDSESIKSSKNEAKCSRISVEPILLQKFKDPEDACLKLIPRINNANTHNYGELLVEVLRGRLRDMPLDEFYQLIYNSTNLSSNQDKTPRTLKEDNSVKKKAKLEGFRICSFILEVFGPSHMRNSSKSCELVENKLLESMNFYEFLRTFLAIKILFDSIDEVDEKIHGQQALPRLSIYKAYCLICEKLTQSYTAVPNFSKFHKQIVVGVSQLGRIIKLVYPNLKIRRLGRRGYSRHHYLRMTWNRSIIDSEILHVLKLEEANPIRRRYDRENKKNEVKDSSEKKSYSGEISENKYEGNVVQSCLGMKRSLYSFVRMISKLPDFACSPRVWEYFPGKTPKPSHWARKVILRSLKILLKYNIDMEPFIQNFEYFIFSASELNFLFDNFVTYIDTLIYADSGEEAYMNLYLTVLLLIFPIVLASDIEVHYEAKALLRTNLATFIQKLRLRIKSVPEGKSAHLTNFSHIIRKMIHMSEMTLSRVPVNLVKRITKEIVMDLLKSTETNEGICKTAHEEIVFNAVIMASNAYRPAFVDQNSDLTAKDNTKVIVGIAKAFVTFASAGRRSLLKVPDSMNVQDLNCETFDLPFQMFKSLAKYFHEVCLSDPFVLKLPIQVINFILFKMNKDVQDMSFRSFANRGREVSKETFKTWWVHSALAEEYMQIFAEISALVTLIS